jgi:hypothetical protein
MQDNPWALPERNDAINTGERREWAGNGNFGETNAPEKVVQACVGWFDSKSACRPAAVFPGRGWKVGEADRAGNLHVALVPDER